MNSRCSLDHLVCAGDQSGRHCRSWHRIGSIGPFDRGLASSNDFQIFSRMNFQELTAMRGDKIRPSQLLIFGRGGLLQPLLPEFLTSAIDLPLKVLIWEDDVGKIWIAYNTGELLRERHNIRGKDEFLKRMTEVTASFAKKATE